MRTTLTIADDVLAAARAIARERNQAIGEVISDLARKALHPPAARGWRDGVPLLPVSRPDALVTLDIVNTLRDEAP